jgi:aldose 1-epimerase
MPDGREVHACWLQNANGTMMQVISFGATLSSLQIPLPDGGIVDVVLGFDTLENYIQSYNLKSPPYMGAIIGRYAGRINKGQFCLNEKQYHLEINNNGHSLHGGLLGFGRALWQFTRVHSGPDPSVTLTHTSPDGDGNYPGEVRVEVSYTLTEENEVRIEYHAVSDADTIINLTHHSYFNLNGHSDTVLNQLVRVNATEILETDVDLIPTGNFIKLKETPFDFSAARMCPAIIDTSFVLDKSKEPAAELYSAKNKLRMKVFTDQPCVHLYVGGNTEHLAGKYGNFYHAANGICFEAQHFPDAPNHAHFPKTVLRKGECYSQKTSYLFEFE